LKAAYTARDKGLEAGLNALPVASETTRLVVQRGTPLSVHSLVEMILDSSTMRAVEDTTMRRLAAIATATLMTGVDRGIL
jgi:hypothetical protein